MHRISHGISLLSSRQGIFSNSQLDHNKDKDGAEEKIIRLQKVNGPDVLGMVAKKRAPCLTGWNR